MRVSFIMTTIVVLGGFFQASAALPVYRVYKTNQTITLDGKPTEAIWSTVDSVMRITIIKGSGTPSASDTSALVWAKALFDSTRLYLYIWADEKYLWDTITGYDAWGLWNQKVAEVFIDDTGDDKNFVEYNFGINGAVGDFLGKQKFYANATAAVNTDAWKCVFLYNSLPGVGVFTKGTLSTTANPQAPRNMDIDTGFGMEIAIPLDSLKRFGPATATVDVLGPKFHVPPRNLESLRVNIYYTGCKPGTTNHLFWDWSTAVVTDFHDTKNFGTFIFIDTVEHGTVTAVAAQSSEQSDRFAMAVSPEYLTIALSNKSTMISVALFDLAGNMILTSNRIKGNRCIISKNLNLPTGTYIIRIQTDNRSMARKVLIR